MAHQELSATVSMACAAVNSLPRSVSRTWTYLRKSAGVRISSRRQTPESMAGRLLLVQEHEEQAGLHELECLDEGASGLAVMDSVHLGDEGVGAFCKVGAVAPVGTPLQVASVLALLIGNSLAFHGSSGDLPV